MADSQNRTCSVCRTNKALDDFRIDSTRLHGRAYKCRECESRLVAQYQRDNARKINAKQAVYEAVRRGLLVRQSCEACGDVRVVAHHDDYLQQLSVRWLCRSHHQRWHAENGEGANAHAQ